MQKKRVTVTVDEELLQEASTAVSEGRSRSVSEWIGEAMAQRRDRDQRESAGCSGNSDVLIL